MMVSMITMAKFMISMRSRIRTVRNAQGCQHFKRIKNMLWENLYDSDDLNEDTTHRVASV